MPDEPVPPGSPDAGDVARAAQLVVEGRPAEAARMLQAILRVMPESSSARLGLARAYAAQAAGGHAAMRPLAAREYVRLIALLPPVLEDHLAILDPAAAVGATPLLRAAYRGSHQRLPFVEECLSRLDALERVATRRRRVRSLRLAAVVGMAAALIMGINALRDAFVPVALPVDPPVHLQHGNMVEDVRFGPDGSIVSCGFNHEVALWEPARLAAAGRVGMDGTIWSVAVSPRGDRLAAAGDEVRLWKLPSLEPLASRQVPDHRAKLVDFSPDGSAVAVTTWGPEVALWNPDTLADIRAFSQNGNGINAVRFSPDGRRVATAGYDRTITIRDVGDWEATTVLESRDFNGGEIFALAWSPDSRRIAAGQANGGIRIWDVGARSVRRVLHLPGEWTGGLAWSPDGTVLAAGGVKTGVCLFRAASGRRLRVLEASGGTVHALAFSGDGRRLAAAMQCGEVVVWELKR